VHTELTKLCWVLLFASVV